MPTLKAAGSLSVGERDRRFSPAITSAFDIGTMTRLATGPAWSKFSGAQQAAVREAFARFLVAEYAHQVGDYSGESFVVDPQTSPDLGRRRSRQDQAAPAGRPDGADQLSRSRRPHHRRLSQWHDQRSRDPSRRIRLDPRPAAAARTPWSRHCASGPRPCWRASRSAKRLRSLPPSASVLIVSGLKREAAILEGPGRTALCGDAPTLRARLAEAASLRPSLVISWGLCGGLDPRLRPGDLILGAEVVSDEGAVRTDEAVTASLARRLLGAGARVGVERLAACRRAGPYRRRQGGPAPRYGSVGGRHGKPDRRPLRARAAGSVRDSARCR